ncbi:MAG: hypothetical protein A2Z29_07630 [Chloroflexi bacterium RBG_16_56_11]|nr:MAG: hypothetical protein A2Z29_07630 [Chloroflexi bacterium RBG_16_56_11]
MAEYLNRDIKAIITEFPAVADILGRYDIGCVSCGLGTCLFKDVVAIHDLSAEEEAALMAGIAGILYPGRDVVIPATARQDRPKTVGTRYSPPLQKLVDEHGLIKRWVAIIPEFIENLDIATEAGRQEIRQGIDFIRSFADKYHHAKEEAILFKYFDESLDIIKIMCADHENARARVREMLAALERQDRETIATHLKAYRDLLTEHIKKEDEVLYRWMDRNLSTSQVGKLFAAFSEKDGEFGGAPKNYEDFIIHLEKKYKIMEVSK